MAPERPDLSQASPAIRAYIEELEAELRRYRQPRQTHGYMTPPPETRGEEVESPGVSEPPTTLNLVTASALGAIKRSPRHLYLRQRRGGMGVFDLETRGDDTPALLAIADESQSLLIFTNWARVFRLPVSKLAESAVHARGESLSERLDFEPGETPVCLLPAQASGYVALVSQSGMVRCLRHHLFGEYLKPGTVLFNPHENGQLVTACWSPGDGDLLLVTRAGLAIRFSEKQIPPKGETGIRLSADDQVAAITPVDEDSSVFILGADGKGALRLMKGFAPNKSPGGSGKLAMKAGKVAAALTVEPGDDVFILTRLGKLIRFHADEVAASEGVVQGVNCISLRADEVVYAARGAPLP